MAKKYKSKGRDRVENATKPVFLHVLNKDLAHASKRDPLQCVMAKACKRELHAEEVRVHLSRVYIKRRGVWTRYMTPGSLRTEIVSFDRGGGFTPDTYRLTPPPKDRRTGKQQGSKRGQSSRAKHMQLERRPPHHFLHVRKRAPRGISEAFLEGKTSGEKE